MTADEIVARIQDVGSLATRADTTSQKILDEVNSEYFSRLVPLFRKMRSGFFRDTLDTAIVANQVAYALPTRAIESGIEQVKYLDSAGNEVCGLKEIPPRQIGRVYAQEWVVSATDTASMPVAFWFSQGALNLSPAVSTATGSLRQYYQRRPGKLVLDTTTADGHTKVFTIASIAVVGGNSTITLSGSHAELGNSVTCDIMSAKSPYALLYKDAAATDASANTIATTLVFNGIDLSTIGAVAGDFVTFANQAYIPEIPMEWHELLLDLGVARMLNKLGQLTSERAMRASIAEKLSVLLASTSPRGGNTAKYLRPF